MTIFIGLVLAFLLFFCILFLIGACISAAKIDNLLLHPDFFKDSNITSDSIEKDSSSPLSNN